MSGPWLGFDDPPNPCPPWWRPFARRTWCRRQMALNLIFLKWHDSLAPRRDLRLEDVNRVKNLMAERGEKP